MAEVELAWQASLLDGGSGEEPAIDRFATVERRALDGTAWVDVAPGWLRGADALFAELVDRAPWRNRTRHMYGAKVAEPRLTAWYPEATPFPVIEDMRSALSERYERAFDSVGLNLYRDGRDSVAWHGDRIAKTVVDPVVAIVSLGSPRRFLLRPAPPARGGSTPLVVRPGDLLVMGGSCQRTWQHTVPKVRAAGPRVSITFRHGVAGGYPQTT